MEAGLFVNPVFDTGHVRPSSWRVKRVIHAAVICLLAVNSVSICSLGQLSGRGDRGLGKHAEQGPTEGGHQSFDCRVAVTCPGTGTTERVSHDDAEKHDDAFDCSLYAGCSLGTVAFLLS